ncbi:MAG: DUF192 domain-containing protein [Candidatus Omnitrophica bacterium]|nr:DUF192 domain-containing protein [Candidatus Omnitrophota bacterium]MCF7876765.1 DUF192 domain-containing protein [Candidatus Omnitrophota bacterium]MCF7878195.1 DUF192 domain-containing protein [Candidatus Omnitrophota bacterium]MCF7892681.1 DUF192 domain-containing protein [Candidatus Omnitrophota bacterium]
MKFKIINETKQIDLVNSAQVASGFFLRLLGLMFKKKIGPEQALIFYRAPSIHTFFMRFPIDIIFLDQEMKVKRLIQGLKPWRFVVCRGAQITIELPPAKISQVKAQIGDKIEITPQSPTSQNKGTFPSFISSC